MSTVAPPVPAPRRRRKATKLKRRQTRLAWIREVNRRALRSHAREDLTLRLTYAPEAADLARELVRRETSCCGFLRFDLREASDAVHVTVTAPEEARVAAQTMFEQLAAR